MRTRSPNCEFISAKPQKLYVANVVAMLGSMGGQFQEVGGWVERLLQDGWTGIRTAKVSRKAAVVRCLLGRNKQENSRRLWSWWASSTWGSLDSSYALFLKLSR